MQIKRIIETAFHRNGICGAPFHVALFEDCGEEASRKFAIVFDEPQHIAVLDVDKLYGGIVAFGQNSWRGDKYESELRRILSDRRRSSSPTGGTTPPADAASESTNTKSHTNHQPKDNL